MDANLYPDLHAPKDGYVFVVTYGRSGSTLTQSLLNSIPGYCIRGENGNLLYHFAQAANVVSSWDNYTWRQEQKIKPQENRHISLRDTLGTPKDPWYGAENVDADHFSRAMMDLFVRDILKNPEGVRVSGFKEIRFHEDKKFFQAYLGIVKKYFPKARFIFQTRDHESVSKSGWWKNREKSDVIAMVKGANSMYGEFSKRNPGICYTIEYERYAEGASYVSEIFDFLEEKPDWEKVSAILGKKLTHCR
ncbi:sulfotransferase [Paracoccus versutus]